MSKKKPTFQSRLKSLPVVIKLGTFLKKTSLPGFKGVSIYKILTFFIEETQRDDLNTRANSMAYSFFISLFPFLIILFSVISLLPLENVLELSMTLVDDLLPYKAHAFIQDLIEAVFKKGRIDLLSIGFILAIYFASNGMEAMMRGFDKSYDKTFKKRNFLMRRLLAIRLTLIIGFLCVLALVLILGSGLLMTWLKDNTVAGNWTFFSFNLIRYFFIFLLFYGVIGTIYHLAPPVKKRFSYFSIGTNFATLFSLLTSSAFSYFVDKFGNYDTFYGPLGTLVMIMLWMQINCMIILSGFELNAGIAVHRDVDA